ncbi:hypothetical protein [Pseudomonas sp. MYb118]|uniref:hypothetical protein n=1 Tax=Pseudomonas sp. MYb118 TaxID=1848720 RepID=UPI0034CF90A4
MEDFPLIFGVVMGVAPAFFILTLVKGHEPWRFTSLLTGIILIFEATLVLGMMTELSSIFSFLKGKGGMTEEMIEHAQRNNSLWAIMFPAIVGAIGANYVTAWFQSKKP